MRPFFFLFLVLALLIISCKKSSLNTTIPIGTYKGTFQRSIMNKVSNVTLQFSSNSYKGQSDSIHYPDICKGSFSISKDTVSFTNTCFYTANFDWTYILDRKYKISVFGDSLIMTREYNGFVYYFDTYKLKKQKI